MHFVLRGALATSALFAFAFVTLPASAQTTLGCTSGGAGGLIPTAGTGGGGAWPTTLPPSELSSTISVGSIPAGATVVSEIKLNGLTHTFVGDLQIVLDDPAGNRHNVVHRPGSTGGSFGNGGDLSGNYSIVETSGTAFPGAAVIPPGAYNQTAGDWPAGTNSIDNALFSAIPAATGNWKLTIYDWAGGDTGALTDWEVCFGTPPPPPPPPPSSNCIPPQGAGGAIPTAGTGGDGSTWPTTFPLNEFSSSIAVTVPAGATSIVRVRLLGLSHTWVGDLQVVLDDPSGGRHNLVHRPGSTGGSVGFNCDRNGDYSIYESFGDDLSLGCSPGDYTQYFGDWPTGTNGVNNTPLSQVPLLNGQYKLTIYDWAGGDTGALNNWDICVDTPTGPTAFCTAGTSTNGCVPAISGTAQPNVGNTNACVINVANVEGQKSGLIFYGLSKLTPAVPWAVSSSSFLCVKAPTQRMSTQSSGGTSGQCNGALTQNWTAYQAANPGSLGHPFAAGQKFYLQGWYRDPPAPKTTNLTDALELTMQP